MFSFNFSQCLIHPWSASWCTELLNYLRYLSPLWTNQPPNPWTQLSSWNMCIPSTCWWMSTAPHFHWTVSKRTISIHMFAIISSDMVRYRESLSRASMNSSYSRAFTSATARAVACLASWYSMSQPLPTIWGMDLDQKNEIQDVCGQMSFLHWKVFLGRWMSGFLSSIIRWEISDVRWRWFFSVSHQKTGDTLTAKHLGILSYWEYVIVALCN